MHSRFQEKHPFESFNWGQESRSSKKTWKSRKGEKNVHGSETSLVTKRHRFGKRQDMSFSDSLLWLLWMVSVSLSLSATEFPLWTILVQGSEATAACSGGIFWSLMGNVVHSEALTLERGSGTEIPMGSHNGICSSVSVALDNFQCSTFHEIKKKEIGFGGKCFSTFFFQAFAHIFCTIKPYYPAVWKGWTLHLSTCSTLTALASPPWPYGLMFWTITCSQFHNGH